MTIFGSPRGNIELRDCTITQRIFEGLAGDPGRVVIIDGPTGRKVTAKALMDEIKSLAGGLTEQGLGCGHCIALMAPNTPEFCSVFHAVAWAGGTVTTLNPTYTASEVRHQLEDSGAEALVTVPSLLDTAKAGAEGTGVTRIFVIGEADGAVPLGALMGPPIPEQVPVDVQDHVVVLPYSSGTTGLPKGVMLTHRNLVVNVDQIQACVGIAPGEMTPVFLPFFHIYGLEVVMNTYLAAGGGLITMPRFDLEQFLRLTQDHKARRLWIAPPVALALAKHPLVDQFDLSSLEVVISAAAPLGADVCQAMGRRLGCTTMQAYGMTELSPASHVNSQAAPRAGSVGPSVPGTSCRIVDPASGEDLGANGEGELWIKGPQVMKGYHGNSEATASTITADGWLRTGDIAVIDDEGYLFIRDRLKELIKFKGFQIAPAELEAVLVAHPGISDAAVIGAPDEEAGEVPVAFVVGANGHTPGIDEIQSHIASQLASYKQPRSIAFVDAIPKSASGKILRRVLRDRLAG